MTGILFVALGVLLLILLRWQRTSPTRGHWADSETGRTHIGFAFPLWSVALVLVGVALLAEPGPEHYPPTLLERVRAWLFMAIFLTAWATLLTGLAAVLGLPMPNRLLPKWVRERDEEQTRLRDQGNGNR